MATEHSTNLSEIVKEVDQKLPYSTPKLIIHGKASQLTAAGSGVRTERKRGRGAKSKRA